MVRTHSPAGGRTVQPAAAGVWGRLKRGVLRVLLWGSTKIQQLLWRLRWLIYLYGVFIALLIAIHLASPDPRPEPAAFPAECPRDVRFGCSRVAEAAQHGARGLAPAYLESSVEFVQVRGRGRAGGRAGQGRAGPGGQQGCCEGGRWRAGQ